MQFGKNSLVQNWMSGRTMKRLMIFLLFSLFASLVSSSAQAGLFFCNETGSKLYLAVGYKVDGTWQSRGWFPMKPNECANPLTGFLPNRYYYYYAEGNGKEWADSSGKGGWFGLHDTNKFHYTVEKNCNGKNFIQVDIGEYDQYTVTLTESQRSPNQAAINCRSHIGDRDAFAECWVRQMATSRQKDILDCMKNTATDAAMAICAAKGSLGGASAKVAGCAQEYAENKQLTKFVNCALDGQLSDQNRALLNCAIEHRGSLSAAALCAGASKMTDSQRKMYACVSENFSNYKKAGACIIASRLSEDQLKIAECVMNNRGSYIQMGVCAAGDSLTPEQQVMVECAISSGGQPWAFAGCAGTRLTLNELEKCMTHGIGGSGCFGDNNTVVKTVKNAWKDVTEGPGPNNDVFGKDGWLATQGRNAWNDLTHGPGPNNEFCKLGLC